MRIRESGLPHAPTAGEDRATSVTGRPHVYWAGTTPSDRVAVVMQPALTTAETPETIAGVVGVDPRTGSLALLAVDFPSPAETGDQAFRFGPGGRTVLALEQGRPQFLSDEVEYDGTGKAIRKWRQMTAADGVVLAQLPDGIGMTQPALLVGDTVGATADDRVAIVAAEGVVPPKANQRNGRVG